MQLSRQRIAESVLETLERLQQRHDIPKDVGYDLAAAATALRHLQHVDHGGDQSVLTFGRQILTTLQAMRATPLSGIAVAPQVHELLDTAIGAARRLVDSPLVGGELKRSFDTFLREIDGRFSQIASLAPKDVAPLFAAYAADLLQQHNSFELFDKGPPVANQEMSTGEPLTEGNLTAYVRDKLSDPTALARNVVVLPGGFGKETSLFSVSSRTLNADLVMRRDAPIDSFSGLDCHTAPREFPLLRAVHARGFPAPEPIFFEAQPKIISGPAFTIMRRAPGAVAGDATGGQSRVTAALQSALAQITARLHNIAPLTELAANPAFGAALWNESAQECTRRYLTTWYRLYRNSAHLPALWRTVLHAGGRAVSRRDQNVLRHTQRAGRREDGQEN